MIEQSYARVNKELSVVSSNFDFDKTSSVNETTLFKLHGTLGQDTSLGHKTSLIITTDDYDLTSDYREFLFDQLLHETSRRDTLIIGHSLSDPDLNVVFKEVARRKRRSYAPGNIYALIYNEDQNRAKLLEQSLFKVAFGSLDDFFTELNRAAPSHVTVHVDTDDILDCAPSLRPATIDVTHSLQFEAPNVVRLFNGSPASYGDVRSDLTFTRDLASIVEGQLHGDELPLAYLLGPAGFGKTTLARQIMTSLSSAGFSCWEHKSGFRIDPDAWKLVASECEERNINGALFIDDADAHLREIDAIIDHLSQKGIRKFRVLLTAVAGKWHPRTKTPNVFKLGQEYALKRLSASELSSLVDIFDRQGAIAQLVESTFSGFSRPEKLRRLKDRCRSDMFVCLKNIFASDSLDDIILRDYGLLESDLQEIYKVIAAMEASNIEVHRQLVIRVLGVRADTVSGILNRLQDTISERTIDEDNGIYAWSGRHKVISEIILKYKYSDQNHLFALFEKVIDHLNPTYQMEYFTMRGLCDPENGIGRLRDIKKQNFLYRKLISLSPSQRPARHRLIQNLISEKEFESAENEIRVFEGELKSDAPLLRFKVLLLLARAKYVSGLMKEDRLAILRDAVALAATSLNKFAVDKGLHRANCEVGLEYLRQSGEWEVFDQALARLHAASEEALDPELERMRSTFAARAQGL